MLGIRKKNNPGFVLHIAEITRIIESFLKAYMGWFSAKFQVGNTHDDELLGEKENVEGGPFIRIHHYCIGFDLTERENVHD